MTRQSKAAKTKVTQVERVRRMCLALPETMEKLSHGEPTFFVRKRVFAMCSSNHHNDGHIAVVVPAAIGIQAILIGLSRRNTIGLHMLAGPAG